MIISASYRTDIPAFYGEWFLKRLDAGFCEVANPYSGQKYRVDLVGPKVEGYVFWTRNAANFGPALERLRALDLPFYLQITITAYPRSLEPSVVTPEKAIATIADLVARHGAGTVVWRYDPVLLTSLTPPDWHLETFERLAGLLTGLVDEVVLSFAHIYAKTQRNTAQAAERHGFSWRDPEAAEKRALLAQLAKLAHSAGLQPTLCAQPDFLEALLKPARCIDIERLSRRAGRPLKATTKGNRPGCLCAESRDIGAYDTCPHGCVYCYAVRQPALAKARHRVHQSEASSLQPNPNSSRLDDRAV